MKLRLDQISVNRIYQRLVTNALCSFPLLGLVRDDLEKLSEKFKADDDGSPPIVLCSKYTRIPWFFCILKWMVKKGSKDR